MLRALWQEIAAALAASLAAAKTDLQSFLKGLNPAWNLVGRVHFNLAENRRDDDAPFAFLATYTTQLSAQARAQHVPLGQALREYAGAANREKLLSLLLPVQRAAETCEWLRPMLDAGELFHPLRWTPHEAARLLGSVPDLESAGVIVRMPPAWRANRPPRPQVTGTVGARKPSALGLEGVLDFRMAVTLDGEVLSQKEIASLLAGTDSLVLLRGQWVEIDRERLERSIQQFRDAEQLAEREGLSFAAAMRMLAGAAVADEPGDVTVADWSRVTAGPWLADTLQMLRSPDGADADAGLSLRGTLRPYQRVGVQWLRLLSGLRLGACLADDMGLGKTIQVLALLLGGASRAEPAGGARIAAGQLAGGGGEVRARPEGGHRASLGDERRADKRIHRRNTLADARSGDHQLRFVAAHQGAVGDRVALCHSGRGAGDQEPECEADAGGQGAEGDGAHRADRHAGRESPGRSVVDLRFHQSGPAGVCQAVQPLCQGCWPIARPIPTARCANWCGPTSCVG